MWGFLFQVASFAAKAVEIGINYYAAKEKEKDLKRANADRNAILTRQATALDAEKNRKLMVSARVRTAALVSRTATTGGSPESPHRLDNQAVASSLLGAQAFLAETGGISAELRTNASRIRDISNQTTGLGTLLIGGAGGVAASAFAEKAKGEKGDWSEGWKNPFGDDSSEDLLSGYPSGGGVGIF
jgi:hypothetical protein